MYLVQPTETATISELDSYLENLYDDLQAKISGTGLILQLARLPDNLSFLEENGTMHSCHYSHHSVEYVISTLTCRVPLPSSGQGAEGGLEEEHRTLHKHCLHLLLLLHLLSVP